MPLTVEDGLDGEVVALDEKGRSSFQLRWWRHLELDFASGEFLRHVMHAPEDSVHGRSFKQGRTQRTICLHILQRRGSSSKTQPSWPSPM